jgi:hypothetical protein
MGGSLRGPSFIVPRLGPCSVTMDPGPFFLNLKKVEEDASIQKLLVSFGKHEVTGNLTYLQESLTDKNLPTLSW